MTTYGFFVKYAGGLSAGIWFFLVFEILFRRLARKKLTLAENPSIKKLNRVFLIASSLLAATALILGIVGCAVYDGESAMIVFYLFLLLSGVCALAYFLAFALLSRTQRSTEPA